MKLVKLFSIAAVVAGVVALLVFVIPSGEKIIDIREITNPIAKNWKSRIDSICQPGKWSQKEYGTIETGVTLDHGQGNIETDEKNSLVKYLFTSSCACVKNEVDQLFMKSSYLDTTVRSFESSVNFLKGKSTDEGANSDLAAAVNLCSAYRQVLSLIKPAPKVTASYSHPLKAFSGNRDDGGKNKILNNPYYKSHFCRNTALKAKVESMGATPKDAEQQYYDALERCVESHYNSTHNLSQLLDDEIRFRQISTNSAATSRLQKFVNSN